ncbi:hypothetical protein [Streptomyces sp. NPDC002054]|uniref:hypothetical protein n=1 Tax=Streptomyces sp. NPDC002054 TaxID=3154663 RepID=UPI003320161A
MEPLAGEQADQVVEAVSARCRVVEQAEVDEPVEGGPGILYGYPGGEGCQGGVEVRCGYGGESAEHPPGGVAELLVRHGEGSGDLEIAGLELIQPAVLALQPCREIGGVPSGPAGQPVPDDPQGQRQTAAQFGQPGMRPIPAECHVFAQDPGQKLYRLLQRQWSQDEPSDALQPGEQPPAGDQHPARASPRKERAHLLLRSGVVEDDEHTLVAQHRPVQGGAPRDVARDPLLRDTEGAEEQPQRVADGQRMTGHAEQVEEEQPVGMARPKGVSGPDRERGLAHSCGTGDHTDHADARCTLLVYELARPDQFGRAAGEIRDRPGQLAQAASVCPAAA